MVKELQFHILSDNNNNKTFVETCQEDFVYEVQWSKKESVHLSHTSKYMICIALHDKTSNQEKQHKHTERRFKML